MTSLLQIIIILTSGFFLTINYTKRKIELKNIQQYHTGYI